MVDAFVRLMNTDDKFMGPVNLGNPGEFTIRELAEKTLEMTGSSSELINMPLPQDDPTQRQPDISLAKEKLGWEPVIKLEQGLASTIDYFKTVVRKNTAVRKSNAKNQCLYNFLQRRKENRGLPEEPATGGR
jgi:UDP-glucuronate decarboxylase